MTGYDNVLSLVSVLWGPVVYLGGGLYFMGKLKATVNGSVGDITALKQETVMKEHCEDLMKKQDERFVMLLEEIRALRTEIIGKLERSR